MVGGKNGKKKGPKGKKARAKAKLNRQWGEEISDDVLKQQSIRIGKGRLPKKQKQNFMKEANKNVSFMGQQQQHTDNFIRRDNRNNDSDDDDDNNDDSSSQSSNENENDETMVAPMSNLLQSIRKKSKKSKSIKQKQGMKIIKHDDDDDEVMQDDNDDSSSATSESSSEDENEIELLEEGKTSNHNLKNAIEEEEEEEKAEDDGDDDDSIEQNNLDPFRQHFQQPPLSPTEKDNLLEQKSLSTIKIPINESTELQYSLISSKNPMSSPPPQNESEWHALAQSYFQCNKKVLQQNWSIKKKKKKLFSLQQAQIYPYLANYVDLCVTMESTKKREEMHQLYIMHVLNHVMKSRARIQRHNRQLKEIQEKEESNGQQDVPIENNNLADNETKFRDQGFTRPSILVLLPTRGTCYKFIQQLMTLIDGTNATTEYLKNDQIMERFEAEYGPPLDDDDEENDNNGGGGDNDKAAKALAKEQRRKSVLQKKGETWLELFGDNVNSDDDFKIGLAVTLQASKLNKNIIISKKKKKRHDNKSSVKLYSDFYKSDIICASPLGLRMLTNAQQGNNDADEGNNSIGDVDYLSSIEICLSLYSDVLLMQNWDHVNEILSLINQEPTKNNDTDFSRVRNYMLEGQACHWRQFILSSSILDPLMVSTFKRFSKNVAGSIKLRHRTMPQEAAICNVLVPVRQVFQKITANSFDQQSAARLKYFTNTILPQIIKQKHTLIYIPSYFDFCSVRNVLLKKDGARFVSITEYARVSEISRGRARFVQGQKPIMLYTGRSFFFHRHFIRGVRHVIFYSLPEHDMFYSDVVNFLTHNYNIMSNDNGTETLPPPSCLALFTRYEAHALERIVGNTNCNRMIKGEKSTFLFSS